MKDIDSSTAGAEDRDLFILHSSAETDTRFVQSYLVPSLEVAPSHLLLSSSLPPGQRIIDAVERALAACRVTVLILTPAFLRESWASYGEALASYHAVRGSGRLVPILLSDCELPPHLDMWVRLDLRDPARREMELSRLRRMLRASPVSASPSSAPSPARLGRTSRLKNCLMQLGLISFMAVGPPAMTPPQPPFIDAPQPPRAILSMPYVDSRIHSKCSNETKPRFEQAPPGSAASPPPRQFRDKQSAPPGKSARLPRPPPRLDRESAQKRLKDLLFRHDHDEAFRICQGLGKLINDSELARQCRVASCNHSVGDAHDNTTSNSDNRSHLREGCANLD